MDALSTYYQARAAEYEAIYDKPERQDDLQLLRRWLAAEASGRDIVEVACGTGYWTTVAAATARRIVASDLNPGPLEIARAKQLRSHVTFQAGDAYAPPVIAGADTVMAHFWWSHVPRAERARFLDGVARAAPGGRLLMIDNRFAMGSSTPISRRDGAGNTYQARTLGDGSVYEVLKNFPDRGELERDLSAVAGHVEVLELTHYWAVGADLR